MILHGLICFIFIIGCLLTVVSFHTYNKLTSDCLSKKLRINLRIAICIGSVFMALTLGYLLCINTCSIGDLDTKENWKIYIIVFLMFALGVYLIVLVINIKTELKKEGCNKIDIGYLPDILLWISIIQLTIISCFSGLYIYKSINGDSSNKEQSEDVDNESDDFSTKEEQEAEKMETDRQLIQQIERRILAQELRLSKNQVKLNQQKEVKRGKRDREWQNTYDKYLGIQSDIQRQLDSSNKELESINNSSRFSNDNTRFRDRQQQFIFGRPP